MAEDPDVAQARELLAALNEQVNDISDKLQIVEERKQRARARRSRSNQPRTADLRRELYHAYRLIDGIHRRFPVTKQPRASHH